MKGTSAKKVILCTGGLGYVGSHTVISLHQAGYKPIIIDNLSNSHIKCLAHLEEILKDKITFYQADLKNLEEVHKIFVAQQKMGEQIFAAIHFAALKAVADSVTNPLAYYQNNIGSTINLLLAMTKAGCHHLIFSGSACVYGDNPNAKEDAPMVPVNPYGQSKVIVEQMMRDTAKAYVGFHGISLRYFNPVGAHPSGLIGEHPKDKPNNLMPILQRVAIGDIAELQIFGSDYATRDGTCIRDYIHVQDVADAHVAAVKYCDAMKEGFEAINLGSGLGTTVLELVHAFEKASGVTLNKKMVGRRAGDVPILTAVPEKALKLLGWKTKRSIEDCCKDAWRWVSNNPKGYDT